MTIMHEINALLFHLIPTYMMYLWFFPLKNKKRYFPVIVVVFLINALLFNYTDSWFHQDHEHNLFGWKQFASSISTNATFSIAFYAFHSMKSLYREREKLNQALMEKEEAKYKGLLAQINPHFLFNTLNTVYASALKTDENTAEMIMKLSDNFRYLFDEAQNEFVSLSDELRHISNYVELQRERLRDKLEISFRKDVEDLDLLIAPLLLIPFVENAFKYSSILKGNGHEVDITLTESDRVLTFVCLNNYLPKNDENLDMDWKESGIGIQNTRKRLSYLYSDRHQLEISESDNIFKVSLEILL